VKTQKTWRALIVDDEPMARRGVRQLLAVFPSYQVVGECRDGREALIALDRLRPDVVFLDIQMPGIDGFALIERQSIDRMPAVVFLTAYDEYALKAFEAQALDYLLKPVSERRFAAMIRRLSAHLQTKTSHEAGLVVDTTRGVAVVRFDEVDWIESADNYARIWTGERSFLVREPLRALTRRLQPEGFLRVHRRALVSIASVREIRSTSSGQSVVVLTNGRTITVSRRRRADLIATMRIAARGQAR